MMTRQNAIRIDPEREGRVMKAVAAVMAVMLAASAASGQGDDILAKAINKPGANYTVIGTTQTSRWIKDGKVAGGQAMRIEVSAAGANAYDVQAVSPLAKAIVKGHHIAVAVWARAPKAKTDEKMPIPFFGVIGGAPSYTPVATAKVEVGPEWTLYNARGVAPADFPANGASVVLHLAGAKGTIDLGPVFVIDLDAGK